MVLKPEITAKMKQMYIDFDAFDKMFADAQGYHKRAKLFVAEGQRPSLIFNVSSVAMECYLIALCELNGEMPRNHTYISMMNTVEKYIEIPHELSKAIRSLDIIFGICPIDNYYHGTPEPFDADRVLSMCDQVSELFDLAQIESIRLAAKINDFSLN
jgi:HEPN domain-containing protein